MSGDNTAEDRGDFLEPQEEEIKGDEVTDAEVEDATGKTVDNDTGGDTAGADDNDSATSDVADDGADTTTTVSDTPDEGTDKPETPQDKTNVKGIRVPKFRLDAALARAREAEDKLAELQKTPAPEAKAPEAKAPEPTETLEVTRDTKLSEIDAKISDAMADGDRKLVAELMSESRKVEREYTTAVMTQQTEQVQTNTTAEMREEIKLDSILTQLEEQFPIFDANSDKFDADANQYVLRLQKAFIAEGSSSSDALVEAVNYALPALGIDEDGATETQESSEDVKKDVPTKPAKRTSANIDAANRQPPDTSDVGDDSATTGAQDSLPNSMELTEDEYDALPEDTKRRMRGDLA